MIRIPRQSQIMPQVMSQIGKIFPSNKNEEFDTFCKALALIESHKISSLSDLLNYVLPHEPKSKSNQHLQFDEHLTLKQLYESESSYFGPDVPKPFQILMAALFIKLHPEMSFRKYDPLHDKPKFAGILEDWEFNYREFCHWIKNCDGNETLGKIISKNLRENYFIDNVTLIESRFGKIPEFKIGKQRLQWFNVVIVKRDEIPC